MPYLVEVLRDALGTYGRNVRLGNVNCVSAKRGWWTKEVKEDIWRRGGAGWMVGKANVGKSNLFEVVFPKGREEESPNFEKLRSEAGWDAVPSAADVSSGLAAEVPKGVSRHHGAEDQDSEDSPEASHSSNRAAPREPAIPETQEASKDEPETGTLLPPVQPYTAYPTMPIVSSLPGTTASPIRIPFGKNRGELIDLPGLARSDLELYVQPSQRSSLVMKTRIVPEQLVLKHGQSLLLAGGLIRITPATPDLVFLVYPFVPIKSHVTSTEKAEAMQTGKREHSVPSIVTDEAKANISSAGIFELRWDVTKSRAGPLTRASDVGLNPEVLPFHVYSADILIEAVGWVEVVAQVRKRRGQPEDPFGTRANFPKVEVFSPEGKFVGVRKPMGAWLLGGRVKKPVSKRKARPRMSMKSVKGRQLPKKATAP